MNLLVVGATGALGRDIVREAVARGHQTAALVRGPNTALPEPVALVAGDVVERTALAKAVDGHDAVICALGAPSPRRPSTLPRQGTANPVAGMEQSGVRRLVCVTLLGTDASRPNGSFLYRQRSCERSSPCCPTRRAGGCDTGTRARMDGTCEKRWGRSSMRTASPEG